MEMKFSPTDIALKGKTSIDREKSFSVFTQAEAVFSYLISLSEKFTTILLSFVIPNKLVRFVGIGKWKEKRNLIKCRSRFCNFHESSLFFLSLRPSVWLYHRISHFDQNFHFLITWLFNGSTTSVQNEMKIILYDKSSDLKFMKLFSIIPSRFW